MAYQLSDLRTRVRRRLKDNSYSASDIDTFLNDAQTEIADLFHWPFFEKTIEGPLTVGEYTYEQQSDHQLTHALVLIHPTSTQRFWNLSDGYLPSDEFFKRFPAPDSLDNNMPWYWTEWGDQIYFECPADLAYNMRQHYYRLPTDMSADSDVPDFPVDFREALVLGAQYRAEEQRRNFDFAAIIESKFGDKVEDLIERYAVRQLAVPETIIYGSTLNPAYRSN